MRLLMFPESTSTRPNPNKKAGIVSHGNRGAVVGAAARGLVYLSKSAEEGKKQIPALTGVSNDWVLITGRIVAHGHLFSVVAMRVFRGLTTH